MPAPPNLSLPVAGTTNPVASKEAWEQAIQQALNELYTAIQGRVALTDGSLTGTVSAPTAPPSADNLQIANTAFVKDAIENAVLIDPSTYLSAAQESAVRVVSAEEYAVALGAATLANGGRIFSNTVDGLAATSDQEYFSVYATSSMTVYQNQAGAAVEVVEMVPTTSRTQEVYINLDGTVGPFPLVPSPVDVARVSVDVNGLGQHSIDAYSLVDMGSGQRGIQFTNAPAAGARARIRWNEVIATDAGATDAVTITDALLPSIYLQETSQSSTTHIYNNGYHLYIDQLAPAGGNALIELNPRPADEGGHAVVRLGRGYEGTGDVRFSILPGDGVTTPEWEFNANSDSYIFRNRGGRLGLGTPSPQRILHIAHEDPIVRLQDVDDTGLYSEIRADGAAGRLTLSADQGDVAAGSFVNILIDGDEKMRVDEAGQLALGTANPQRLLHLAHQYPIMRLQDTDTAGMYAEIRADGAAGRLTLAADVGGVGSGSYLGLQVGSDEIMRLTSGRADLEGNLFLDVGTGDRFVTVGSERTADGNTYIDLIGDTINPYGLRLFRDDAGENGVSQVYHRGTGALRMGAVDAGSVILMTDSAVRMTVDAAGNVGIGEGSPDQLLHLSAVSTPTIKMEESGDPNTTMELSFDNGTATLRSERATGVSAVSLGPVSADGTSAARVRMFRGTNTTGRVSLDILEGNNTSDIHSSLSPTGDSYLNKTSGNVGIGEDSPDYKLDVNGTFGFTPGNAVDPASDGDVVFEATNDTTLTIKHRGLDGTVRSSTLALVA